MKFEKFGPLEDNKVALAFLDGALNGSMVRGHLNLAIESSFTALTLPWLLYQEG